MLQYDDNVIKCVIEVILAGREPNLGGNNGDIWMVVEPPMDVDVYRKAILLENNRANIDEVSSV